MHEKSGQNLLRSMKPKQVGDVHLVPSTSRFLIDNTPNLGGNRGAFANVRFLPRADSPLNLGEYAVVSAGDYTATL